MYLNTKFPFFFFVLSICAFSLIEKCYPFNSVSTAVTYDKSIKAIKVKVPDSDEEFFLHPATVRRNDRSAQSVYVDS